MLSRKALATALTQTNSITATTSRCASPADAITSVNASPTARISPTWRARGPMSSARERGVRNGAGKANMPR
eukprot:scaffold1123_cov347-Prasinococcus_capsulatus_cf.AAC.10